MPEPNPHRQKVRRLAELLREAREAARELDPKSLLDCHRSGYSEIPNGMFLFGDSEAPDRVAILAPWNEP